MIIVAVWQCDAKSGEDNHHKRHNQTEKIIVKNENGKLLIVNVPKSKVNETKHRQKLLIDEDGSSVIKRGESEIEVVKLKDGKKFNTSGGKLLGGTRSGSVFVKC